MHRTVGVMQPQDEVQQALIIRHARAGEAQVGCAPPLTSVDRGGLLRCAQGSWREGGC
jgi:hypothetical protein